ncbi:MAG TPA: hypothetical protein VHG92_00475, partial [Afifellaceae bacterium]|nr:hypothetical protein [Afifellaceae bacterium]
AAAQWRRTMVSRRVAAALVLGALLAQPAAAGSFGFGLSIQSGPGWYDPGPRYAPYPPPVNVEPRYHAPALLSPREIERHLRRNGYSRLEVVALRGPIYTVQGVDPWHNIVEMQVSGQDGRVLYSEVVTVELFDTPFGHRPPVAVPDRGYPGPVLREGGPRTVGAVPQAPPQMRGRTAPQIVTAPLPRERPAYSPPADEPAQTGAIKPAPLPEEAEERPGGRDPLVVY